MLFNNPPNNTRNKTHKKSHLHYGTAAKARQTLRYLKQKPINEQRRSAHAMYYRAKYHAHQTDGMRAAMKVYATFLRSRTVKH
jgi:hypothetical protein